MSLVLHGRVGRNRVWLRGRVGWGILECFNMALLVKQGWRLLQNPDSIVAKVLKEKYYSGKSFLSPS
jgi:hypothetical protein